MGGLREPRGHNGAVGAGDGRGGGGLGWGDWLTRRRDRGGKEKQVGRGLLLALRCVALRATRVGQTGANAVQTTVPLLLLTS